MNDSTTAEQRAYFHTLSFLIAEAERPRDPSDMSQALRSLLGQAQRVANLRRVAWEEWQRSQERHLIELMDHLGIEVPEDLRMAAD